MLDLAALERWLRGIDGFAAAKVLGVTPVEGGASNLTYRVRLAGGRHESVALRLQREQGIFAPYDVLREGAVLRRLVQSPIPVPAVFGTEPSAEPLGAPFIVLEWVDAPHMGEAGPEASFAAYTEMVAAIHALDWAVLGLEFLGVPASAAAATRGEVETVARRMAAFGCEREPLLLRARDQLLGGIPGGGRLALCQGDINVFNYLFRAGEVVAVVDWEQARIGDPRSDVGQLLALSNLKGAPFGPAGRMPFAAAYAAAAGTALAGMEFFRARWLFELGVIYHGWRRFNRSEPWYTWGQVAALLERALGELEG